MSMNLAFYQGHAAPYYRAIAKRMGMGAPINPDFSRGNALRTLHVPMVTTAGMNGLGAVRNLALNKSASQSSTFPTSASSSAASLAVDGNRDGNYVTGKSVTNTLLERQPWWQVDLGQIFNIERVDIYNRTDGEPGLNYGDRLKDFFVFVSDAPFISNDPSIISQQPGVGVYYSAGRAGPLAVIPVGRTGRFVRIQLSQDSNFLHIAEVEVYGDDIASAPPPPPPTNGGSTTGGGSSTIGGGTTPMSPLPPISIPAPIAQLPLIGPVATQGAGFLNQTFNLFGISIPYYAPLVGVGVYYFFFRRRRR